MAIAQGLFRFDRSSAVRLRRAFAQATFRPLRRRLVRNGERSWLHGQRETRAKANCGDVRQSRLQLMIACLNWLPAVFVPEQIQPLVQPSLPIVIALNSRERDAVYCRP